MIAITLDGKRVEARKGEFLLAVARREGIDIPALCHHEAVEPSGACRLCMVEITLPAWDGWSKVVTACLFPAEDGLIVLTNSDRVRKLRKETLELLYARCPSAEAVRTLAAEYGVIYPRHQVKEDGDNCTLCGICTRICQTHVTGAIATLERGIEKKVDKPFPDVVDSCIGCLSCARACPTDAIEVEDNGKQRTIWGRTFDVLACTECGAPTVTPEQADWLAGRTGLAVEELTICDRCKASKTAAAYSRIAW